MRKQPTLANKKAVAAAARCVIPTLFAAHVNKNGLGFSLDILGVCMKV